jgi:hypothetical protein
MQLIGNLTESLVPMMIFAIPIVAIIGGITAGIVKTMSQGRIVEMAQRERIAAIQAGIDPSKLPPLPMTSDFSDTTQSLSDPVAAARNRSQGLLIGGFVTLLGGIGVGLFLGILNDGDRVWAVGIIPAFVGVALLISGFLVRPRGN